MVHHVWRMSLLDSSYGRHLPEVLGIAFVVGVLVTTAYVACGRSLELLPDRGETTEARFGEPTWSESRPQLGFVRSSLVASGLAMLKRCCCCGSEGAGVVVGQRGTGDRASRAERRRALGVLAWAAGVVLGLVVVLSAVR